MHGRTDRPFLKTYPAAKSAKMRRISSAMKVSFESGLTCAAAKRPISSKTISRTLSA